MQALRVSVERSRPTRGSSVLTVDYGERTRTRQFADWRILYLLLSRSRLWRGATLTVDGREIGPLGNALVTEYLDTTRNDHTRRGTR